MYTGLYVKYRLFLSDLNENLIFLTAFLKILNIKFRENPSIGNRVVPCRRTDRCSDLAKLIVAFCNFVNLPNKTAAHHELYVTHWFLYKILPLSIRLIKSKPNLLQIFNVQIVFLLSFNGFNNYFVLTVYNNKATYNHNIPTYLHA